MHLVWCQECAFGFSFTINPGPPQQKVSLAVLSASLCQESFPNLRQGPAEVKAWVGQSLKIN